ncbi:MAG TPA: alpha/beta hydrolase [Methylophaga sp.]|nr:alpha/beta hydrolase [Methylophaga sp.]
MKKFTFKVSKKIGKILLNIFTGGFVTLLAVAVIYLNNQSDLKVWHTAELDAEFSESTPVENFTEYLALENRLFAQLKEQVYDQIEPEDQVIINRFHHASLSDPERWPRNWNRSFELSSDQATVGVLLLHGMSDSPYSLKTLGQRLHAEGAHVVGLRLPGHGTSPSGLLDVRWQDMAAAVKLAVKHLYEQVGEQPIYIVGYSNGGALALNYVLSVIEDPSLPPVKKLVLISPQIAVTKVAALAIWQERLGNILGLEKLQWNAILPEYDPFKYNSFTINAGNQSYRLTVENQLQISTLAPTGKLDQLPQMLTFQSVLDSTVSSPAVVHKLLEQVPDRGHELVLFDINRRTHIEYMLKLDPNTLISEISSNANSRFIFSLVTNENENSPRVVVRTQKTGQTDDLSQTDINLSWPSGVFSLGHLALSFTEQDPLYGIGQYKDNPRVQLGHLAFRGERGMLRIPASAMLRIRWNPFYPYLEQRVLSHIFTDDFAGNN